MLPVLALAALSCNRSGGAGNQAQYGEGQASLRPAALWQGEGDPGPDPAMNKPDETAWRLFGDVVSDQGGAPKFTSWASDADTFKENPVWPGEQKNLSATPGTIKPRTARPTLMLAGRGKLKTAAHQIAPNTLHDVATEEVRRNRPAFDFIKSNRLYSYSGLKAAFGRDLRFTKGSLEVKTNWLPVGQLAKYYPKEVAADPHRYFLVLKDGMGAEHALLSMHIISNLVPNWTWATFEHWANPGRCDIIGCRDSFGATKAVVPPNPQPEGNYGMCDKTPALQAILAKLPKVFANYCLKGSQTDFTDPTGLAIRLGNSITEGGFVESSSCMTCHATAAWKPDGSPLDTGTPIGPVPSTDFWTTGSKPPMQGAPDLKRVATQADFVWAIPFCAFDDRDPKNPKASRCA